MAKLKKASPLHGKLVNILNDYLGPASERFLDRHIEAYLQITPNSFSIEHIIQLNEWVKASMDQLTEDKKLVDKCMNRIESLGPIE